MGKRGARRQDFSYSKKTREKIQQITGVYLLYILYPLDFWNNNRIIDWKPVFYILIYS